MSYVDISMYEKMHIHFYVKQPSFDNSSQVQCQINFSFLKTHVVMYDLILWCMRWLTFIIKAINIFNKCYLFSWTFFSNDSSNFDMNFEKLLLEFRFFAIILESSRMNKVENYGYLGTIRRFLVDIYFLNSL